MRTILTTISLIILATLLMACVDKTLDKLLPDIVIGYQVGDSDKQVTGNIVLAKTLKSDNTININWSTSDEKIISATGEVTRKPQIQEVIVTAYLYKGDLVKPTIKSKVKEFRLVVAKEEPSAETFLQHAKSGLTISLEVDDDIQLIKELPIMIDNVVKTVIITWETNNVNVITSKGKVIRQKIDTEVTLKAKLTLDESSAEKEFIVIVKAVSFVDPEHPTDDDYINKAIANLIFRIEIYENIEFIVMVEVTINEITRTVAIAWESENPTVISNEGVIAQTNEEQYAAVIATFSLNGTSKKHTYEFMIMPEIISDYLITWDVVPYVSQFDMYIEEALVGVANKNIYDLEAHLELFSSGKVRVRAVYQFEGEDVYAYDKSVSISNYEEVYTTGFEDSVKGGYAPGAVEIKGVSWSFNQALVGTHINDNGHGAKVARLRTGGGYISNETPILGASGISFYYASYVGHTTTMTVEIKGINTEWVNIFSTNVSKGVKNEIQFFQKNLVDDYSEGLFVRVTNTYTGSGTNSLNIDDVTFLKYSAVTTITEEDYIPDYDLWRERFENDRKITLAKRLTENAIFDKEAYYQGITSESVNKTNLNTFLNANFGGTTYGDARFILEESDLVANDSLNMRLMYTDKLKLNAWDGGTWDREHVWPNSRLGAGSHPGNSDITLQTDVHNLRAIDRSVNSSRSNKFFSDVTTSDYYFPGDLDKGDVARILMYMIVMYPELSLTAETAPAINLSMGKITMLKRWHDEDVVDNFESSRNQVIYEYQNNRNPFIDMPELFDTIYQIELTKQFLNLKVVSAKTDLRFTRKTMYIN